MLALRERRDAMAPTHDVLFVDDEPNVLSGLRRMLRGKIADWRMDFASGGEEALQLLTERGYDAIVTDMRMPRTDGAELLAQVEQQYPHMIRIILSGQCNQEGALRSVGPSHLFLSKPCDAETLVSTIDRALALRRFIYNAPVRKAIAGLRAIPSLPASYQTIRRAMDDPNCPPHRLAEAVEHDPAVTAKLLHIANSAYFAPRRTIATVTQAVQYLGIDVMRAVVLSSSVIDQFSGQQVAGEVITRVWEHSLRTAAGARMAAGLLAGGGGRLPDEAYTAGLLHDIGILALEAAFPGRHAALMQGAGSETELADDEDAVFGADHGAVGGYLMGLWGLPDAIIEAIAFHHQPSACIDPTAPLLQAVSLACAIDNAAQQGLDEAEALAPYGDPQLATAAAAIWKAVTK